MATLKAIHAAGGHENIAAVLDVFEDVASYFFVLELVRHRRHRRRRRRRPLPRLDLHWCQLFPFKNYHFV